MQRHHKDSEMINQDTVLQMSRKFRLQWEESQQKHVLLYAEGMVQLNDSATEILQLCDGKRSVQDIINILQNKFQEDNVPSDVMTFLAEAIDKGWIVAQ